jgi:pilus assembly protein CpaC
VEAVAITQREIVLNGKAPGETTVLIWQRNGAGRLAYEVTVEPSDAKAEALRHQLQEEVGDSVKAELGDKTVFLRGTVKTQAEGEKALAIASAWGKPVNLLQVATPPAKQQILLKVKFVDVDRSASQQLGLNIISTGAGKTVGAISTQQFGPPSLGTVSAAGPQTFTLSTLLNLFLYDPKLNLGATIEALEGKNLVQILAEPNVLATDGVPASFLAGGEFPFPVVQNSTNGTNNVTIQCREFGVRLSFTPVITPRGTIRLEVAPEVSSLDYANGLTYNGFNIPGLDVRRVKTEVELENNQSFAIAGLLDNRVTENLSKLPGLGNIPLFGKLFQSRSVAKSNSELMVVVTPELVQPAPAAASSPAIDMPRPFLKDGATTLPQVNSPDTRQLPVSPLVPFVPAEAPPSGPGAGATSLQDAAASLANSFKATK